MTRGVTRRVTLTGRILAALDARVGGVATSELVLLVGAGLPDPRRNVWSALWRLERNGLVARHVVAAGTARSKRSKRRGVCVSCGRDRAIECRGACFRCYADPARRPTGPRGVAKVAYWTTV